MKIILILFYVKAILASALFAAALARPDGPRYGAAPVYEELAPQPFAYQYGVADDYSKANFNKQETQDNYGKRYIAFLFFLSLRQKFKP
jgi:hypothetical protein